MNQLVNGSNHQLISISLNQSICQILTQSEINQSVLIN